MKKWILMLLMLIIVMSALCGCGDGEAVELKKTNINIYKDTEAWELAKAVNNQDTSKIEKIAEKNPELLNLKDPKYETPLLVWAVGMEKYKSVEALLKAGADPNIISGITGGTAIFEAAGFSWIDNQAKKDAKYVELLLRYGADPNINYVGREKYLVSPSGKKGADAIELGTSPLMASIGCGLEKTKALVEAGAEIDYMTPSGRTAAVSALHWGNIPEYAHYLIVEKQAKITEPYAITIWDGDDPLDRKYYPVDILRDYSWMYELDSEEHKIKMEIVEEFARQGVDYWSTEIHSRDLETIKKRYPDTWEEYVKKY